MRIDLERDAGVRVAELVAHVGEGRAGLHQEARVAVGEVVHANAANCSRMRCAIRLAVSRSPIYLACRRPPWLMKTDHAPWWNLDSYTHA